MGSVDVEGAAATIWTARRAGQLLDPQVVLGAITIDEAYAVQGALTQHRLAAGERLVGWKLGYTSAAMREQMGVDEPNYGPLTDAMVLGDGDAVDGALVQPRVEPEIALRLRRPLSAVDTRVERDDVLEAVGAAVACLEIVHSTWRDYRFTLEHNTADGSSAAQVVLGAVLEVDDLAAVEVELTVDGAMAGSGCGADAGGHPADGVVWLLDKLALAGVGLRAGDVVITGGLTRAVALAPGGTASARYSHGGLRQPVTIAVHRRAPGGVDL